MKLILENWNKFLNEEKKGAYSFDYDETLIKYKTDPEDPEFSTIYDKPHEENIAKLRELAAAGETVYIVTSRSKRTREKYPWDTAPDPEELVADLNLPVKSIHYTNGDLKAETLLSLGVIEHWDDDEEEIAAAKEAGIKANFVPGDKEIRETMLSMWANKLQEAGIEPAPKMKKYLKDHPYMEPDGLQERCQKGYKTHPTRKTKKMYGKTYRNCVKAEGEELEEKKDDRCTRIAKRKYDVWPSAYASGAVVKCRQGKIWKDLKEDVEVSDLEIKIRQALHDEGGAAGIEGLVKKVGASEDEISAAVDKADAILFSAGGEIGARIDAANGERWVRVLEAESLLARVRGQTRSWQAGGDLYRQRQIMNVYAATLPGMRKFVAAVDPSRLDIDMDLKTIDPLFAISDALGTGDEGLSE